MTITMLTAKIHRATVTQAELDYVGSITAVSYTHLDVYKRQVEGNSCRQEKAARRHP